MDKIVIQDFTR